MADAPQDDRQRRTGILAGQLAALGGAFRTRLARDREALGGEYAALAGADVDAPASLKRIELAAHKLHGTAAMFGYAELGEAAGRLERAAREALQAGAGAQAAHAALARAHAGLATEIDVALVAPPPEPSIASRGPGSPPQTK